MNAFFQHGKELSADGRELAPSGAEIKDVAGTTPFWAKFTVSSLVKGC